MSRTIPEIRERLYELATEMRCPELRQLADETKRRSFGKRAPKRASRVTPAMAIRVKAFCKANPKISQREVGRMFNIDGGRVNEILHGYRNGKPYTI